MQEVEAMRVVAAAMAAAARQMAGTERMVSSGSQIHQLEIQNAVSGDEPKTGFLCKGTGASSPIELVGERLMNLPPPTM